MSVQGVDSMVENSWLRVQGVEERVLSSGFRVWFGVLSPGLTPEFTVHGSGFDFGVRAHRRCSARAALESPSPTMIGALHWSCRVKKLRACGPGFRVEGSWNGDSAFWFKVWNLEVCSPGFRGSFLWVHRNMFQNFGICDLSQGTIDVRRGSPEGEPWGEVYPNDRE